MSSFYFKSCKFHLFTYVFVYIRAGEPENFLSAPAPDFFQAAPAPVFFKWLRFQGAKNPRLRPAPAPAPAPDYWLSLAKYSFPRKLKVKL